jgi:hypothetical protein
MVAVILPSSSAPVVDLDADVHGCHLVRLLVADSGDEGGRGGPSS